jgi:hypothetical protein
VILKTAREACNLRPQLIDLFLGIRGERWLTLRAGISRGGMVHALAVFKPLGFQLNLLAEKSPLLTEPIWGILREHGKTRSRIGQAAAQACREPVECCLHQGLGCAHGGRPGRGQA